MDESYEVVEGEEVSYRAGPYALPDPHGFCNDDQTPTAKGASVSGLDCANGNDPVYNVVGVGSNGFPGYSPEFSDTYERNSYALYGDLSGDVSDVLFLQGAVRYEDYDDFDAELVWKLAGKLDVTDTFGLRASIGTAFRAPTPGQQGTTNVSTRLPNGFPVATGLFPAGGPVAQALGAVPLRPEKSDNYTFGFTAQVLDDIDVTVDFYRIDVQDRTQAISTRDVSTDPTSGEAYENYLKLDAAGVAGANSIGGVFYFTNGFNTSTQGMDIVATTPIEWGEMGTTILTASFNYTKNSFDTDASAYLNDEARYDFENFDPNWRGVITARHELNQLSLIGRPELLRRVGQLQWQWRLPEIPDFRPHLVIPTSKDSIALTICSGCRSEPETYSTSIPHRIQSATIAVAACIRRQPAWIGRERITTVV